MLKRLRAACVVILLISINLLGMHDPKSDRKLVKKEEKKYRDILFNAPSSVPYFQQQSIVLNNNNVNQHSLIFNRQNPCITHYLLEGNSVAKLIQIDDEVNFESISSKACNFSLQIPYQAGSLTINTEGRCVFNETINAYSAYLTCKAVDFREDFYSDNGLIIKADSCKNHAQLTSSDFLFNGKEFEIAPKSSLNAHNSLTLMTQSLVNQGTVNCRKESFIRSFLFENPGTFTSSNMLFEGNKIANSGMLVIGDTFYCASKLFNNSRVLDISRDCIMEKGDVFSSTASSVLNINGNWKAFINSFYLNGSCNIKNLHIIGKHFIAEQALHCIADKIHLKIEGDVTNEGVIKVLGLLDVDSKNIILEKTSSIMTDKADLKAEQEIHNEGSVSVKEHLSAHAHCIGNMGKIRTNSSNIKADRYYCNAILSSLSAKNNLTINTPMYCNVLGFINAQSLMINSAVEVNTLGVHTAKHMGVNSLLSLNTGLLLPKVDALSELYSPAIVWGLGESLFTKYFPFYGLIYTALKSIKGTYDQGGALYNEISLLRQQKRVGASCVIALLCSIKNTVNSARQACQLGKQSYHLLFDSSQSDISEVFTTSPNFVTKLKDTAKHIVSGVMSYYMPSSSTTSVIDLNYGVAIGGNNHSTSLYHRNSNVSLYAHNTIDTRYAENSGFLGGYSVNLNATSSCDSDGPIRAANVALEGKWCANIKGDISANTIGIKSDGYMKIDSHLVAKDTHLCSKNLDQRGIIDAQQVAVKGDRIRNDGTIKAPKLIVTRANLPRLSWLDFSDPSYFENRGNLDVSEQIFVESGYIELNKRTEINTPNAYFKSGNSFKNDGSINSEQMVLEAKKDMTNNGSLKACKIGISQGDHNDKSWYVFHNKGSIEASEQLSVNAENIELHKSSEINTPSAYLKSDGGWQNDGNINSEQMVLEAKKDMTNNGSLKACKIGISQGDHKDKSWYAFHNKGSIDASEQLFVKAENIELHKSSEINTPTAYFKSDGYWKNDGNLKTEQCIVDSKGRAINTNNISAEQLLHVKAQDILFSSQSNVKSKDACYKADQDVSINGLMDIERGSIDAGGKVKSIGKLGASEQLDVKAKDIIIERSSQVSANTAVLKATQAISNQGTLATSNLSAHANYVTNFGTINSNNAHIKADRCFWNACGGSVNVEDNLSIDTIGLFNVLGYISADSICTNSIIDSNLLGIYVGKNICQNSCVSYNAGLWLPKAKSLDEAVELAKNDPRKFARTFVLPVAEKIILPFVPQLATIYSLAKPAAMFFTEEGRQVSFLGRIESVVENIKKLDNKEDLCASDVVPVICQANNIAVSVIQTVGQICDVGEQIYHNGQGYLNGQPDIVKNSLPEQKVSNNHTVPSFDTAMAFVVSHIPTTASTIASIVGPHLSRNSLLDINNGLILGVNGNLQSLHSMNGGGSFFLNNNSVSTISGTNTGWIGGGNVSVNAATTYTSSGVVAGINANMAANNLNVKNDVYVVSNLNLNARNKANINADLNGRNIHINAKEVELKKESTINASGGSAQIVAKTITNEAAIKGNTVCMQANVISLQDSSDICAQEGDRVVAIQAKEYLEAADGSAIHGGTVAIDATSFKGDIGNRISSTNQTYIKTAHLDNQGTLVGNSVLEFTGDSSQLKGIGTVDHLRYYGTLENNLADTFAEAKSDLVNVTQSGSVTLFAGDQNVHLKDEHLMNHALKIESSDAIKCDKKLTSTQFVDLNAKGNLEHKSIAAGGKVNLGGKNIIATPNVTCTGDETNCEDHVEDITVTGSGIEVHADQHILYEAVETYSGKDGTTMTAGGKNISAAVIAEKHIENQTVNHKTQETETTKDTFTTAHVCKHTSEGIITMLAGDTVEQHGTTIDSRGGRPIIHGKNGVNGYEVKEVHIHESEYTKKGGWLRSGKHNYRKTCSSTAKIVNFIGDNIPEISSDAKISMAFTADSSRIVLNAPSIEIKVVENKTLSYSKNDWSNVVWESDKSLNKENVTYLPFFTGTIQTNAEKIFCQEVKGHASPTYETINNDVVITRNILEETHQHQKQSIQRPTRATVCVVAMAVAMATSGLGSSLGATMATTIGCKSAVSATVVANATAAAVTALNVQVADALLKCNGDLGAAAKVIASTDTLKKLVLSAATAGATGGAGQLLNKVGLPAIQEGRNLGERLLYAAPRQITNATIRTVANIVTGQECKEAIEQNVRSALAGTIGAACASQIGDAYGKEQIGSVSHKLLHTGLGAVEGAIVGGLDGAIAGSIGALVTETVADALAPEIPSLTNIKLLEAQLGRPLTQEEFTQNWDDQMSTYWQGVSSTADISRFAAASVALLARQDVDITNTVSSTAIDNNFLILAGYGLVTAGVAYSAYEINNAYKEGGPQAALKRLGIEVGMYVVSAGVVKVGFKVGRVMYPTAKLAVAAALESEPVLKFVLGEFVEFIALAGENIGKSALGKGVSAVEAQLVNTTDTITQKLGNVGASFAEDLVDHVVPRNVISKMEAQATKQVVENAETTFVQTLGNLTKPDLVMTTPEGIKISVPDTGEAGLFQSMEKMGSTSNDIGVIKGEFKSILKETEERLFLEIDHPVVNNIKTGKALKLDKHHAFPDIIDNFAQQAEKFNIKGGDEILRELYQVEGSLNGQNGIFEWIVDPRPNLGVTHRFFIKNGKITGKPNIW